VAAAHEALDRVDRVLGVGDGLAPGDLPDQDLTLVVPRHHRWGQPAALLVRDDLRILPFHDGHDRVRGAELDADGFAHCRVSLLIPFPAWIRRVGPYRLRDAANVSTRDPPSNLEDRVHRACFRRAGPRVLEEATVANVATPRPQRIARAINPRLS